VTSGTQALVGRERELEELRRGLELARTGSGGLFMVAGDPGVGKTALADVLGAEAAASGSLVLWGRAWDGGGAPAFWPWLRILRRLAAERDVAEALGGLGPVAADRLARLAPELARDGHGDHGLPDDSDTARFELFDAVTSLLKAASQNAGEPLVLVLDDLHGADHPSLLLLGFLAAQLRDARLLVIGTYREAEARLDPQLAAALAKIIRHGRRLPLRGLRERDVGEVIERVAGERPERAVVEAIHHATEGNPFFVDELVRLLSAEGRLGDSEGDVLLRIPDGVRETIRHRLDPLPEPARELLATASVLGREFRLAALERVVPLAGEELEAALSEALGSGVLTEVPGGLGMLGFSHGLIRETLYEDLGPQRRGALHREAALALEELYGGDLEPHLAELAHHFFVAATAGDLDGAIDYSVRAGERAMELVAYEEAAGHFERALQAYGLQERADVPRRCDLLLALGAAQSRSGDAQPARETFRRAAGLARRLGSPERLARAALGYGAGLGGFELGRVDEELVALLHEARTALGEDSVLHARVLGRLATELYFSERMPERARLSGEALAMARRLGDPEAMASTLAARYLALWGPDDTAERATIAADIVALGQELRDRELVLRGRVWRIVALMELGDWPLVDAELSVHAAGAEELRDPLHLWYVPLFRATRALVDGRLEEAERHAGEAFAAGRPTQAQNAAQLFAAQMFALRAEQGRLAEIEAELRAFGRRYPAQPVWRGATAFAQIALGRPDIARGEFEQLTAGGLADIPRDGEWLATVAVLVRVGERLGDVPEQMAELADALAPYADLAVIAGRGAVCLSPVARYAGIAAACAGRGAEAVALHERALGMALRWGSEPVAAAVRGDLAAALEARGEPGDAERAAGLRAEGRRAAERLGLAALAERLGVAGTTSPAGPAAAPRLARAPGATALLTPTRPAGAFYRRGEVWTISGGRPAVQLRDAKGLQHLARLLGAPHVEFHALDLVGGAAAGGGGTDAGSVVADGLAVRARGSADTGPALDPQAKAAYRARISELQEEIDEADAFHDPERAVRAREELAFVSRELASAVGLGGRDRRTGSDAERARVNVTRAIRTALRRIADADAELGHRLGTAVRTGTYCVYAPERRDEVFWDLDGPT
jgi:hypothetical protein